MCDVRDQQQDTYVHLRKALKQCCSMLHLHPVERAIIRDSMQHSIVELKDLHCRACCVNLQREAEIQFTDSFSPCLHASEWGGSPQAR